MNDFISLNNSTCCDYVDRIYYNELEIIDTTFTAKSTSYIVETDSE